MTPEHCTHECVCCNYPDYIDKGDPCTIRCKHDTRHSAAQQPPADALAELEKWIKSSWKYRDDGSVCWKPDFHANELLEEIARVRQRGGAP